MWAVFFAFFLNSYTFVAAIKVKTNKEKPEVKSEWDASALYSPRG